MKLNADIVFHGLKDHYDVEMYGPKVNELVLSRPEFYMEEEDVFSSNHLYLATVEHLPKRPRIQEGSVLICIGENLKLNYYKEKLCLILIKNRSDFFKVYHSIQRIFDYYDEWEKKIHYDLFSGFDIQTILSDSEEMFHTDLFVLDNSFRVVASTFQEGKHQWSNTENGPLNSELLSQFLSESDLMTDQKNAIRFTSQGTNALCVNLFNKNNQYEGCLVVPLEKNDFVDGEDKLAEQLASYLELAIEKNPLIINDSQSSIKSVLQNLIEEQPLSHSQRMLLTSSNGRVSYVCVYMKYNRKRNQLPMNYICDIFEDTFQNSFAFVYEHAIVSFVNIDELKPTEDYDYRIQLNQKLNEFVDQMGLCAGISNAFRDLFNVRIQLLQGISAVENGLLLDQNGKLFYFESYALTEMVINSLGGLPVETYYPTGFQSLLEHDKESGISYLETLTVFLEENMSYTSTAQKLYIHRSTLIDRIARIEKELGIELKDSDKRLQLEILLKAMNLEELLRIK